MSPPPINRRAVELADGPGPQGAGLVTFLRTYARHVKDGDDSSPLETYGQCIDRCLRACQEQLHCGFTDDELREFRYLLMNMKCFLAGRFMWQLGTKTVEKYGLLSLQNCAAIALRGDNVVEALCWIFDCLCLGVGVGFNIEDDTIASIETVRGYKLVCLHEDPNSYYTDAYEYTEEEKNSIMPKADNGVYMVGDSREGWTDTLRQVLRRHFPENGSLHERIEGGQTFFINTWFVRPRGSMIKGFGGKASGHETFVAGLKEINRLLNLSIGKRPSAVTLLDVANLEGHIVVSGNVRRSAELALGSAENLAFIAAKNWTTGTIPYWRSNSNNSVVASRVTALPDEFWEGYGGDSEPYGLINLDLYRSCGQTNGGGAFAKPNPEIICVNPCGEQGLENAETCCLGEIVPCRCESEDEFMRAVYYIYRVCKHSLRLPCHWEWTREVVHRNMRMGIGVTGFMETSEEQRQWLPRTARWLDVYDRDVYSPQHDFPASKRLRTVKPSGTLSLLAGVTAGAHPAEDYFYLKRMRMASDSPLLEWLRERGYHVEPLEYVVV